MFSIDLTHFEHLPHNKVIDFSNDIKFSRYMTYTKKHIFKFETHKEYGRIGVLFIKHNDKYHLDELQKNGTTIFKKGLSSSNPSLSPEKLFNLFKIEEIKSHSLIQSHRKKNSILRFLKLKK